MLFQLATALVTSCAGQRMPEMIVVGIGAPAEALEETQMRRNFDFSPTKTSGYKGFGSVSHSEREKAGEEKRKADGERAINQFGGAPRFLPFVTQDIRQKLAQDYRMADDHTLFGHSGGGLFCTYALVTHPQAFNRYAQQHRDLPAAVFFGVGEKEVLDGNTLGIFSSTARFPEILKTRAYPSLKLRFRAFEGESHTSVIPPLLAWGLRSVWEGDSARK